MKLIVKGLLMTVLFVLLLVSVRAELSEVFYDDNLFDNFPYGNHKMGYTSGDEGTAFRGYQRIGSMWNAELNAYAWNENLFVAFCRGGGDDCPHDSGRYEAWVEFYGFVPEARPLWIHYYLDDGMSLTIGSDSVSYSIVDNYLTLTRQLPAGWSYFKIYYWDIGGGKDHLFFVNRDGPSNNNANDVPYHKYFTALVSPDKYELITPVIHLNEGSVAGDCKDFIDNDGDWNLEGDFSNDGAAAFDFNEARYGIDPPEGRGYKILNDDYPQFGELNVDCFDEGCEGQDGPYDWNGNLGKCNYQTEKIQYCDDGYDNDFDGKTDLEDDDCTSFCEAGEFNTDVITALGTNFNPTANDGSDGCCGDDPVSVCAKGNVLPNFAPCNYNTQLACESEEHCKWESNTCTVKTHSEYCSQFSQSACPANICEWVEGDYGYVTPNNDYLCYNNKTNFNGGTTDKWMWIYAPEKPFIITPLNFSGKTVDYISNSEEWYYCDANPTLGLKGLRVDEYKTFPDAEFGGLTMTCSEAATFLTASYSQLPYEDCSVAQGPNCCVDQGGRFNILEHPEMLKECYCKTSSVTGQEKPFCEIEENKQLPICKDYSFTNDKILTEFCAQNPRNCVTLDHYDTSKSCSNQPFQAGHNCSANQVCSNGIILPVLNEELCCIGVSASCIDKSQITNQQICEESGGQPYTPSNTTFCLPENQSIQMSLEEGACCFGAILYTDNFPWSSFENRNNNTFSCFAYQGNNLFGQCCYGVCNSMNLFTPTYVDSTRNRAFSIKLPFNIQNSYDLNNVTAGILQDYSWKTTTPNFEFYQIAYFAGKKNISMAYYDNLEFDVIYNQLSTIKNIYINDVDYGPITNYVNNGDKRGVAHHIRIPLRPESKMDMLRKIRTLTNSSTVNVVYDNIYFSINTDSPESSLNNYCTGGFASWIDDLDSPITDPNDIFFTGENAYMTGYGKYAITCDAYLPYGWTGHRCCGDDTNQTNYGEYYEDSPNPTWPTSGGCFEGSKVVEGETVWKIKGYVEDNTKIFLEEDELKSYIYSDLIYADDAFFGCQVPNNKYSNLRVSYDGRTLESANLVNDFINDQCAVVGTYYCMNGIWRQYVPGLKQNYSQLNNIYLPAIPSQLELKAVPPATNLIKNSNFGGECPSTICAQQGNNSGT